MKTKLLKQVRKRFKIIHMPKGFLGVNGQILDYNLYELIDSSSYRYNSCIVQLGINKNYLHQYCSFERIFDTEQECINYLTNRIIYRLRQEGHRQRKDKIIFNSQKKVWYNN